MRTYRAYINSYVRWNGGYGIDQRRYDRYILSMRKGRRGQNGISTSSAVLREYARFTGTDIGSWQSPRTQMIPTRYLRPNEIEMLRDACRRLDAKGDRSFAMDRLFMFDFLLGTGMRVAEFVHLLWSDIDLVAGTCAIRMAKENKSRIIRLSATASSAAERYLRRKYGNITVQKARLIPDRVCTIGIRAIEYALDVIAEEAGLTVLGIHPHLLRHTFAVMAIKNDWLSQRELQMHLGHASIATTVRYEQFSLLEGEKKLAGADFVSHDTVNFSQ